MFRFLLFGLLSLIITIVECGPGRNPGGGSGCDPDKVQYCCHYTDGDVSDTSSYESTPCDVFKPDTSECGGIVNAPILSNGQTNCGKDACAKHQGTDVCKVTWTNSETGDQIVRVCNDDDPSFTQITISNGC